MTGEFFTPRRARLHVLVMTEADQTVDAVRRLRAEEFEVHDVHSPFAVHGLDEALGLRETRLPRATLLGGSLGVAIGLGFQIWSGTTSWALEIGGKTPLALPALMPVTFEMAVLLAALFSVAGLFLASRLLPRVRPPRQPVRAVTDDRFAIVVREGDASFDAKRFAVLAQELGAERTIESWRVY